MDDRCFSPLSAGAVTDFPSICPFCENSSGPPFKCNHDLNKALVRHTVSSAAVIAALAMLDAPGLEWARAFVWARDCAAEDLAVLTSPENLASAVVLTAGQACFMFDGHGFTQDVHYLFVPVLTVGKHSVGVAVVLEEAKAINTPKDMSSAPVLKTLGKSSSIPYGSHGRFVLDNETGVCGRGSFSISFLMLWDASFRIASMQNSSLTVWRSPFLLPLPSTGVSSVIMASLRRRSRPCGGAALVVSNFARAEGRPVALSPSFIAGKLLVVLEGKNRASIVCRPYP